MIHLSPLSLYQLLLDVGCQVFIRVQNTELREKTNSGTKKLRLYVRSVWAKVDDQLSELVSFYRAILVRTF